MITGINHIAVILSSEESVEFYKKIGFQEVFRKERKNDTVVILECQGIRLEIFVDSNHPARATNPENIGLRHLAFEVNDLEKVRNELTCGPILKDWFGWNYCFTTDPDGLQIEFLEITKNETISNELNEDWVKEHIKKYGKEPNLFDGV